MLGNEYIGGNGLRPTQLTRVRNASIYRLGIRWVKKSFLLFLRVTHTETIVPLSSNTPDDGNLFLIH